jgi:hypothetical protein
LYALGIIVEVRGDLRNAQAIGEEFVALGKSTGDLRIAIAGRLRLGAAVAYQGHFIAAHDNLWEALSECTQGAQAPLEIPVSTTPEVACLTFLAWTFAYLGYPDQATAHAEQAVIRARQLGPMPLVFAPNGTQREHFWSSIWSAELARL